MASFIKHTSFIINKNIQRLKYLRQLTRVCIAYIRSFGVKKFVAKAIEMKQKRSTISYSKWIKEVETVFFNSIDFEKAINQFNYQPLISVLIPLYNVRPEHFKKCLDSVVKQTYTNWEICIYDDGSVINQEENHRLVMKLSEKFGERIKFKSSSTNSHISIALNKCLEMASGKFFTVLDDDDLLSENALFFVVNELNIKPDLNFIYSDEDKINAKDERFSPIFKPDWSPETNLNGMYTTHLGVYRTKLVKDLDGFRKGYEGSQDFDLILRLTETIKPETISHIPLVLYHWRSHSESTSQDVYLKPYVIEATKRAMEDAIKRRGIKGNITEGIVPNTYKVNFNIQGDPRVAIIIPTHNQYTFLKRCIESIEAKTEYKNYSVLIVDNRTDGEKDLEYLSNVEKQHKVIKYDKQFNFSAINNFAFKHTDAEHILLLNNDTEVINSDWLTNMLEYSQQKEIGAVGAKLLYPDDTIQHAGVILGIQGVAAHGHKHFDERELGHMGRINKVQNIAAVTGACMMVKSNIYEEVGGLDEANLKIAFNDVDFCLKLHSKGNRNIYTPFARLYHYESISRGLEDDPVKIERFKKEIEYMQQKWADLLFNDPYYNINLTRELENFDCRTVSYEYFEDLADRFKLGSLIAH